MKSLLLFLIFVIGYFVNSDPIKWKRLTKSKKIVFPMHPPLSSNLINYVNYVANTTWKAGPTDRFKTISDIRSALGVIEDPNHPRLPEKKELNDIELPLSFDARQKWPFCKSLAEIRDQGNCASSWAFGAVETITDRYCIHSNGTQTPRISAEDLLTCCGSICGFGCNGGYAISSWYYWVNIGIVTGGAYATNVGCRDYSFPACSHHTAGPYPSCTGTRQTPSCVQRCQSTYNKSYYEDKHFGYVAYYLPGEPYMMNEIFTNGPIEVSFDVYADFFNYKSGVYQHVTGAPQGSHSVKIIGWGIENGTPYWTVANSWNPTWGAYGFFKIKRGSNECNIEGAAYAGLPRL